MGVEIRVPSLGESVSEATVARWFKQIGDKVTEDEPIVELETDKVTLEFNAPASGTLAEILVEEGGDVEVGALLGSIDQDGGAATAEGPGKEASAERADGALSPAVRKLIDEHGLDPASITATGPELAVAVDGRELLRWRDEDAPFLSGQIGLGNGPRCHTRFEQVTIPGKTNEL